MWSNWTRIIPNDEEMITEVRTRFICKTALISNQQTLQIKSDQINYRICDKNSHNCQETGKIIVVM
jgi:hypothetical protein